MTHLSMRIDGMTCNHCVGAVRRALTDINGVTVDEVELGIAKVHYNASMTSASAITQAVEEEGYAVVSAA